MPIDVRIPQDIRALRSGLGLSQEALARVLDVSVRTIRRWETAPAHTNDAAVLRGLGLLAEISRLATEVYGPDVARFMSTPRSTLAMRTPTEALIGGQLKGVRDVLIGTLEGSWA